MFKLTGLGDEISFYLEEQMDVLESEGIKHIELRGVGAKGVLDLNNEDIKEIKEQLDARGFAISAIASPIGKIGIEDDFDPHLERFKKAMDVAHAFETPYIRFRQLRSGKTEAIYAMFRKISRLYCLCTRKGC